VQWQYHVTSELEWIVNGADNLICRLRRTNAVSDSTYKKKYKTNFRTFSNRTLLPEPKRRDNGGHKPTPHKGTGMLRLPWNCPWEHMPVSVHNAFHESEQGYRLLFDSNPHPMWIYDRDTLAFLAVNDAAIQHYGYSRDEFLRMSLKDIRPAQDVPWLLEKVSNIKPGMNSASGRHLKKNGRLVNVEIVSHTLQFRGRRAELVLAMDVADSKTVQPQNLRTAPHGSDALEKFQDNRLTEAENRVAKYVAHGFSNKQIAVFLRVSVRTVENHISHILSKKGFTNRVEIARYVLESSLGARGS
jgi:PAS domain S-box-containing protein